MNPKFHRQRAKSAKNSEKKMNFQTSEGFKQRHFFTWRLGGKTFLYLVCVLIFRPVFAEDRVSENDMFGGPSVSPTATPAADSSKKTKVSAVETQVPDIPSAEKSIAGAASSEESLQMGGTFSSEADFFIQDHVPFLDNTASNPNILFLYLDSKLESDSRVFAKIRAFYDPTGVSGGNPDTAGLTDPYGLSNGTSDNLQVSLQELKLSFNVDRKVFFTVGRQQVKYGAAKFFNPTDFLNPQPFNFFLPSDERPGVDMVKAQLPSGTANLYAAGLVGNPTTGSSSGGYFRGELGYDGGGDFFGGGEISLSGYLPKNQPGRAGFDISQALGDVDFYFEGAAGQDSSGAWKDATSVGAGWAFRYGDRSSNTVTLEAEHFQAGAQAEYGVFSIDLPEPGSLTNITFVETNLYSFIDGSGLSRLDTIYQFTTQISGRVYTSGHWGNLGGVFHIPGQVAELGARVDVDF